MISQALVIATGMTETGERAASGPRVGVKEGQALRQEFQCTLA